MALSILGILEAAGLHAITMDNDRVPGTEPNSRGLVEQDHTQIIPQHLSAELHRIVITAHEVDGYAGVDHVGYLGQNSDVMSHDEMPRGQPDIEEIAVDQESARCLRHE